MKLLEHEAKDIFRQHGIRTPKGAAAENIENITKIYQGIGGEVAIKPAGIKGREKKGIMAFAKNKDELVDFSAKLLGSNIEGEKIKEVLVEEKIDIEKEFYMAITIDYAIRRPVLIISTEGGVDIEETAKASPEKIKRIPIDMTRGINKEEIKENMKGFDIKNQEEFLETITNLYRVFRKYDAETAEINPLAVTSEGRLVAVDALLIVNDDSLFRHPELEMLDKERKYRTEHEKIMGEMGWSYIDMDGNIGIICSGAGLSMATLDLIQIYGGKPTNFLDMAQVDGDGIYKAFEILTTKDNLSVIMVNLFAGLNRCDSMAEGIKNFVTKNQVKVPIVVRMVGNREEEGAKVLKEAGLDNFSELEEAVRAAVTVSRNGFG